MKRCCSIQPLAFVSAAVLLTASVRTFADDEPLNFSASADLDITLVVNSLAAANDSAFAAGFLKIRNVTRVPGLGSINTLFLKVPNYTEPQRRTVHHRLTMKVEPLTEKRSPI